MRYAIVKIPQTFTDVWGLHVYAPHRKNKYALSAYRKEIQEKNPACRVIITDEETAKKMLAVWRNHFKNWGAKKSLEEKKKSAKGHKTKKLNYYKILERVV